LELRRADRRLKRLPGRRLEQALAIELEALVLELALLRENLALHLEAPRVRFRGAHAGVLAHRVISDGLLKLELLLFHTLLEVKLIEPARIARREIVAPRACALPQAQLEGVLLLLHVEPRIRREGARRGETRQRHGCCKADKSHST
jgi:hypothetical protein